MRNFLCYWRSYLRFTVKYKIKEWPVSEHTICLYAQFLAYTFHSSRSVRNYMYGICTLHVLVCVMPPDLKDIEVSLTLRGLDKKMKNTVKRAQPLTPDILLDILAFLNLNRFADLVFWGILIVGFFGMLRKSNLIPDNVDSYDHVKQLSRGHITFQGDLVVIKVTWAKNIQCRQKVLEIPLFSIPGSLLCPVTILKVLMSKRGRVHHPLFGQRGKVCFMYSQFQTKFQKILKRAGYRAKAFSSHSMR